MLDNFEHVLPAARDIADLLADGPRLRCWSRAARAAAARRARVPVAPLALPSRAPPSTSCGYAVRRAVRQPRARGQPRPPPRRRGDAAPSPRSAVGSTACRSRSSSPRRACGCSRRRRCSPAGAAARPAAGGAHDVPARQRTLRDAIGWSYELLTRTSSAVFRAAACSPAASRSRPRRRSLRRPANARARAVEVLLKNSLVRLVEGEAGRVVMLEAIREFALEALDARARPCWRDRRMRATTSPSPSRSSRCCRRARAATRRSRWSGARQSACRPALRARERRSRARAAPRRLARALQRRARRQHRPAARRGAAHGGAR